MPTLDELLKQQQEQFKRLAANSQSQANVQPILKKKPINLLNNSIQKPPTPSFANSPLLSVRKLGNKIPQKINPIMLQQPNTLQRMNQDLKKPTPLLPKKPKGISTGRIGNLLEAINKNTGGGLINAVETVNNFVTGDNVSTSDTLFQRAAQAREQGKKGLGAVGSTAFDVAEGIGGTISAIGASAATGGLVNPLAIMGAQSGGQAAYEARQKGATVGQQLSKGIVSGGIEAITEKLPLDSLKILAKGSKTGVKSLLKGFLKQGALESAQESISYLANTGAGKLILKDLAEDFDLKQLGYSALIGGLSGGVMGGGANMLGANTFDGRNQSYTNNAVNEVNNAYNNANGNLLNLDTSKANSAINKSNSLINRTLLPRNTTAQPIQQQSNINTPLIPKIQPQGQNMARKPLLPQQVQQPIQNVEQPQNNIEALKQNLKQLSPLKRDVEKVNRNFNFSPQDRVQVDRLLKGEITFNDMPTNNGYNLEAINTLYEAKKPVYALEKQLKDYNLQRKSELRSQAEKDVETLPKWKQPDGTLRLSLSTMERNIKRLVPDESVSNNLIKKYIEPVHKMEAERTRLKTTYRNEVKALNLFPIESKAVQFLGEVNSEIEALQEQQGKRKLLPKKGGRLQELLKARYEFLQENPNLNTDKINKSIAKFREIYNTLFEQMNDARVRNGYNVVDFRKNYFPHFSETTPDTVWGKFANGLGINFEVQDLPTTIAGLTHTFKPGTAWFGNTLSRKGDTTVYDALRGFDKYIEGVSDVIMHTDNIQRLRVLSDTIRYRSSDENIQKRVDEIRNNPNLATEEKESLINEAYDKGEKTKGSAFVRELEEYTNLLANKKSKLDRKSEDEIGRGAYNVTTALFNRIAANMVALNPGSWLTNFIPLAQGGASIKNSTMVSATVDTLKSFINDDGFENRSTFLTNRKGSDPLIKTTEQKIGDVLSSPMQAIDMTVANILTRAKYYENVHNGMSEQEALAESDDFSAKIMADRSKGATPTRFKARNAITKSYTMFQLEVANQFGYLFGDMPRDFKGKAIKNLAMALFKYAIGSFIYNEIYDKFLNRRPAFDPLGLLKQGVESYAGIEIPNIVDAGGSLLNGKLPQIAQKDKMSKVQATTNLGKEIAGNVPFVGGFIGGGRIPVSSALPSFSKTVTNGLGLITGETNAKKAFTTLGKEWVKPVEYILPPYGGGQVKKTIEGLSALKKGGSYSMDSEGKDILQYPVGNSGGDYAKTLLFGKSSAQEAKNWVDSGFKSLSAKDTQEYKDSLVSGEKPLEAFRKIQEAKKAESKKIFDSKMFNARLKSEVGEFKWQPNVDRIEKVYKEQYGESPGIGLIPKDKQYSYGGAKYELSNDLIIERQKIYKKHLEKEYEGVINRFGRPQDVVYNAKIAKKKASTMADAEFWNTYKGQIGNYKVK